VRIAESERVERHRLPDRLYHWMMAAAVLTLLGTGFLPILGWKFEWVTAHWIAGLVLAALVAGHILRASFWLDFWSMVVGFEDLRSGWCAVGEAFDRKGPRPLKPGKYSLLQKLYHVAIACVVLALVATGSLMLLKIDIYSIHDFCAMSVITLLIAHVYFALRPEKLWMSRSMIRGWISDTDYHTHHDPARWPQTRGR